MYKGPICCPDGIRGYGNTEHGIMIVGQNPAMHELATGLPMTGQDGEILNGVLQAVGWSRDKVYITNVCCTRDISRIGICGERLLKEIEVLKPRLIVTLGALACEFVFHMKISKARGALLYSFYNDARGLATWLPSAIIQSDTPEQQNDYAAELVRDLRKINRYFGLGKTPPTRVETPYQLISKVNEAQQVLDSLPRDSLVTLDIETPIIDKDAREADPYHKILCVGVGLENDIQYIFPEKIIESLDWPTDVQWGGWNIYGFDMVALRDKYGINLPIVHDGMLTSYVRDERTKYGTHKLKNNSREDAGADFYEEDEIRSDLHHLYKYNGYDVAYNHRLLKYHLGAFDADDARLYYDLLIPAANMYSDAQYEGCSIDIIKHFHLTVDYYCAAERMERELVKEAEQYGFPGEINPNSDQQVSRFFFEVLGLDTALSHKTKGGAWSVDKNVLDNVNHPWAAKLRLHRQVSDTRTRYLDGTRAQIKHDGRVHPKCWIPGTTTGRPSYSDPPVQQLPHRRTIGEYAEVRSIFTVDNDDYMMMAADYSQGELWILYGFSGDKNLLADLTEPWSVTGKPDYHSRTTITATPCLEHYHLKDKPHGCATCVAWEFARDNQKHVNFGIPYGETAFGLMRPPPIGTGLPIKECQKLIDLWYKRNAGVLEWQKSIEYILATTGFIKTPSGRKRRFPIVLSKRQIRQAINAPIQGTLSDYTLTAAIECVPKIKQIGGRLLFTTHDEILLHVPRNQEANAREIVTEAMTKPRFTDFPSIPIEIKTGQNLYEISP